MRIFNKIPPPVAIGGVGGSGTRVIANILSELGFFMGTDLNESMDNLAFTLLFKRAALWPPEQHQQAINQACSLFRKASLSNKAWRKREVKYLHTLCESDRPAHSKEWLATRVEQLLQRTEGSAKGGNWGWKEPNTHIVLPALLKQWPAMKYIHVVRHGLDMAYSSNQNQLQLWGEQLLGEPVSNISPSASFQYWCAAHRRIIDIGKTMGGRFLMLNFDTLCQQPASQFEQLFTFLEIEADAALQNALVALIQVPDSLGRHRDQIIDYARPADLQFLTAMGYAVLK